MLSANVSTLVVHNVQVIIFRSVHAFQRGRYGLRVLFLAKEALEFVVGFV